MNQKNKGIIALVASILLCGCPGLLSVCWGGMMAVISFMPNANIDIGGSTDPQSALTLGLVVLCVGVLFVAIPVGVGVYVLRKRNQPAEEPPVM